MNWLARLKNSGNLPEPDATKPTKEGFVASVATSHSLSQKTAKAGDAEDVMCEIEKLKPFAFDTLKDTEDPTMVERLNNLTWELMQADGMTFQEAIALAKGIVISCPVAQCELAYESVMALWRRLSKDKA